MATTISSEEQLQPKPTTDTRSQEDIFTAIQQHGWTHDAEFQAGLAQILSPAIQNRVDQSDEASSRRAHLTERAKCFYYARKVGQKVDFDAFQAWKLRQQPAHGARGAGQGPGHGSRETDAHTADDTPYPASFSEIVELIQSGKPVPGIKEVPDTVLDGQASQAVAPKRLKPWERKVEED